jgi:hypothetical protein
VDCVKYNGLIKFWRIKMKRASYVGEQDTLDSEL